jgi:hypothetical protein
MIEPVGNFMELPSDKYLAETCPSDNSSVETRLLKRDV